MFFLKSYGCLSKPQWCWSLDYECLSKVYWCLSRGYMGACLRLVAARLRLGDCLKFMELDACPIFLLFFLSKNNEN